MAWSAKKHWLGVQQVMRYLQNTIDVGLTFNGSGNEHVVDVFSDADFANSASMFPSCWHSEHEECFRHGCAVVWELCVLEI